MTNEEIIATIRAEVERRKLDGLKHGLTFVPTAMQSLLEFLDTLQEQPVCKDVEEAAWGYASKECEKAAFIAGANWQRNRLLPMIDNICKVCRIQHEKENPVCEGLEEEIERYLHSLGVGYGGWVDGMEDDDLRSIARHFAQWQKEQMMKEAVEASVGRNFTGMQQIYLTIYPERYKDGDKVRIVIVKEDEQ